MLRKLTKAFQDRVELPIEIDEIRDEIVKLGIQDKIIFSPESLDTGILKGAFYQWYESPAPYADADWVTLIVYPEAESIEMQRVICAKELIHVCDKQVVKTNTPELLNSLAKKVLGPFESPESSRADAMAAIDKLAQYQGLDLLLPKAARALAREKIKLGQTTVAEIADIAVIPVTHAELVLEDSWEAISTVLQRIGNGDET